MENGRHKVFKFQITKLDNKIIKYKLEKVINKLNFAAKINIALVLLYPQENNTLFEKSHLLCTKADLIKILRKMEKFDIVEQCTQERQNTKWQFKLIANVIIFAVFLKNFPMGSPDSVLPEPLLRHTQVNCFLTNIDKDHKKSTFVFSAHWKCL